MILHERIITKSKYQVSYVKIIYLFNSKDGIKKGEEIRVTYDCIIKIA